MLEMNSEITFELNTNIPDEVGAAPIAPLVSTTGTPLRPFSGL